MKQDKTVQEMADEVSKYLMLEPKEYFESFLQTPENMLIVYYHNTLGRDIRNQFQLWERKWQPDVRDGVDFSKDHPDQISMEVIKTVWKNHQHLVE